MKSPGVKATSEATHLSMKLSIDICKKLGFDLHLIYFGFLCSALSWLTLSPPVTSPTPSPPHFTTNSI